MNYQLKVYWQNREIIAEAQDGEKLIEVLTHAGVTVSAPCGGRCFCGKCRVRLEGDAGEIMAGEKRFLTEAEIAEGWRLACACTVHSDMKIWAEEAQATVLVAGGEGEEIVLDPAVRLLSGDIPAPSLADQRSDIDRFLDAIGVPDAACSQKLLKKIPAIIRETGHVYAAVFAQGDSSQILDASSEPLAGYAVAVDIGTTTMVAYLIDLATGAQIANASMLNPQRPYGGDVITRAEYTSQNEGGADLMAKLVREAIRDMTLKMLTENGLEAASVRHIALVGNTVMMHLLAGLEVKYIAQLPFVPVYARAMHIAAGELDLPFENAIVTLAPCVSGYVGADTIAALLACDMDKREGMSLMIDIGTNGEIALGGAEKMFCCSAAAGPAFEGAHIRCGSGAVTGSIDRVQIKDGEVNVTTIGGAKAASICGSGIVDAIAQMLDAGIIDETGRIDEDEIPEGYEDCLFETDGGLSFRLTDDVYICQKDVREVQLAKSAIAAGIEILLDEAGIRMKDVQALYLAGGFGNFIDRESACKIGLLPAELLEKIKPIGNGAGTGARRMVLEQQSLVRAEELHSRMKYIELSARADFQELFAENMLFE